MNDPIWNAIKDGDVARLRALLNAEPHLASEPRPYFDNPKALLPPLHLVCDAVFRRLCTDEQGLELAETLIEHGVNVDQAYAKSGDSYLIAAASLGAERVGLRILEQGANVTTRGLFGATALHWSAMMGLDRLAAALVHAGAELDLKDTKYQCTPLQWAQNAWPEGTNGRRDGIPRTAAILIAGGAKVPTDLPAELRGSSGTP